MWSVVICGGLWWSVVVRGATIRQKAYCDILQYRKPVLRYILRYTSYLYFSLLLLSIHDCALTIYLLYKNSKKTSNLKDI